VVGLYALLVNGLASCGPPLIDAFADGRVLSTTAPYERAVLLFGLLPQCLAIVCAVPAAALAKPGRAAIEAELLDVFP
jgi:hypothetical protein